MYTRVKTASEIVAMRESGRMLAQVLAYLEKQVDVGMTTKELATLASQELKRLGGKPVFLGYQGFPSSLCVSVNDEVVHGIPGNRELMDGDIVSMDFGVNFRGMITDAARSVIVGTPDQLDVKLVIATLDSLDAGIFMVRDGVRIGDIAAAVQEVLDHAGYGIVRDLVGHGTGHQLHEQPDIPNYGKAGSGDRLEAGMTIAIEPMVTRGGYKVTLDADRWTIRTADHSRAAHFEDTVLITEDGAEILTRF